MPRPDAPRPARRPGWSAETLPPCPRCKHPMVRWSAYQGTPQMTGARRGEGGDDWWSWFPDALNTLLVLTGLRFVWDSLMGLGRRLKLAQLSRRLRPDDWVCADCLHSRPGSRSATR